MAGCAAATIIKMSGQDALVNRVAEQNNFVRLADVEQGPLMDWILTSGFTQDEIAAIQEPFMPVTDAPVLEPTERAMQWPDALGLGLFTALGTQIAIDAGMPSIIAVILGMVTAVFGGVLRDVVCNEIPRAFSDHRPYAICSFIGYWPSAIHAKRELSELRLAGHFKLLNAKQSAEELVRVAGLEPAHLSALPPQSSVSANSTIRAAGTLMNQFGRLSASAFSVKEVGDPGFAVESSIPMGPDWSELECGFTRSIVAAAWFLQATRAIPVAQSPHKMVAGSGENRMIQVVPKQRLQKLSRYENSHFRTSFFCPRHWIYRRRYIPSTHARRCRRQGAVL